jgi:hypothetical protein
MGSWLLLGVDRLIASIAVGPIMERKWSVLVPFAVLFGVTDGGGWPASCMPSANLLPPGQLPSGQAHHPIPGLAIEMARPGSFMQSTASGSWQNHYSFGR